MGLAVVCCIFKTKQIKSETYVTAALPLAMLMPDDPFQPELELELELEELEEVEALALVDATGT